MPPSVKGLSGCRPPVPGRGRRRRRAPRRRPRASEPRSTIDRGSGQAAAPEAVRGKISQLSCGCPAGASRLASVPRRRWRASCWRRPPRPSTRRARSGRSVWTIRPLGVSSAPSTGRAYGELVRGVVRDRSRRAYLDVIDRLIRRGAEGIIAGCTEIELLVRPEDVACPYFPTARLHAIAPVDAALR